MELPQEFCPRFQLNPEHSRADLGVGRRGPGHPFFLKFCSIFHRIKYLYSWPVKKGSGHPFVHFLNPPLVFRVATKSPNLIFQNRIISNGFTLFLTLFHLLLFIARKYAVRHLRIHFHIQRDCLNLAFLSVDGAGLNGHLKIYSYQLQRNKTWHALKTRPEA